MSGIFLDPNEYCCAEDELILKMSIIKCFLASTHRIWNLRNSWFLSLLQKKCSSIRRRGLKKWWRFSQNRGRFSQNRGRFSRKRWRFFKKRGSFFFWTTEIYSKVSYDWASGLEHSTAILCLENLPSWKASQGCPKVPLKSVAILSPRAGARTRTTAIYAFLLSQPSQISA